MSDPKATAGVIPLSAQSYVYVIGDPTGPQKVGFASDPKRRLALFRTANMGDLRIALAAPISRDFAREAEWYAHWLLREHHARGEWFSVSPEEACAAVEKAVAAVAAGAVAPKVNVVGLGRPKLWKERMHVTLAKGAKAAISAALLPGEDVLSFIRDAIDCELARRGSVPMPPPANEPPAKAVRAKPD